MHSKLTERWAVLAATLGVIATTGLCACNAGVAKGTVVDMRQETLPGVAVIFEGTNRQDLTNARGEYALRLGGQSGRLRFAKTGYAPAVADVGASAGKTVKLPPVTLWRLPSEPGVFLLEQYRYERLDPVSPEKFDTQNLGIVYGTRLWFGTETTDSEPMLVCHKLQPYGVRVSRLHLAELLLRMQVEGTDTVEAWIPTQSIPAALVPIDRPEGQLQRVRCAEPLKPGTYAVHWGILDGAIDAREKRFFVFHVVDARTPKPASAEQETPTE